MPKFSFATTMSMLCIKSNKELKWKCSQMRITIHNEVQSLRKLKTLHRTMPNVLDSRWQDTLRYTEHIHELEQFATSIRYQTVFFFWTDKATTNSDVVCWVTALLNPADVCKGHEREWNLIKSNVEDSNFEVRCHFADFTSPMCSYVWSNRIK